MTSAHHRKILKDNLSVLSDCTCLSSRLLIHCVENKIITRDERTKIERTGHLDDYETKTYFYDKVLKLKDIQTFEKFVQLAQEEDTNQPDDVLNILKKGLMDNITQCLPEYNFENKIRKDGTTFQDVPWTPTTIKTNTEVQPIKKYEIKSNGKFALIVNIIVFEHQHDRRGASFDSIAMATTLKHFGFKIYEIENNEITYEELKQKIKVFKEMCKNGDVCIVAVMSHGERDIILTSDNTRVCIKSDVLAQFNNKNFKEFIGKPKIFFFQACRGREHDIGVSTMQDGNTFTKRINCSDSKIPTWTDMLICYATLERQPSYREENGSWFVQVLCEKIMAHGKCLEINRILTLVAEQMKDEEGSDGEKQMCPWTNIGFIKEFYF